RALQAGADMLLVCHTRETQSRMHQAVCAAVRQGILPEERLLESAQRIERARRLVAPHPPQGGAARVGAANYQDLEARVALAALSLLGNGSRRPRWNRRFPTLVVGEGAVAERFAGALRYEGFAADASPRS